MLFYEIKVTYQRQTGEDNPGNVNETYLVEGVSCSDVEGRLLEYIKPFVFGEVDVKSCKEVRFYDMIPTPEADYWYKSRVEMITIEDNGKESRKAVSILVQAHDVKDGVQQLMKHLDSLDFEIVSITRSPILEVYRAV